MSLWKLFSGKTKEPEEAGGATVIDYVDWLVTYMLRTSNVELVIDSTRPLPGALETNPALIPPCLPPHESALNRLKLLCGLQPAYFSKPTEGSFQRTSGTHNLLISANFNDSPGRAICKIHLRIRSGTSRARDDSAASFRSGIR